MLSKKEYLDVLCREIEFRAARKYLRGELAAHIDDKTEELRKEGVSDPELAAVTAMGDAAVTGKALNKAHRPRTEWSVIVCFILLSVAGLFSLYVGTTWGPYDNVSQIFWLNVDWRPFLYGICAAVIMYFTDYTLLIRFRHIFFGTALVYIAGFAVYNALVPFFFGIGLFGQTAVIVISELFFILSIAGYIQRSNNTGKDIVVIVLCALSIFAMSILSPVYSLLLAIVYIVLLGLNMFQKHSSDKKWVLYVIMSAAIAASFIISMMFKTGTIRIVPDTADYYDTQIVQNMLHGAKLFGASPLFIQNTTWSLSGSSTGYILTAVIGGFGWVAGIGIILIFAALLIIMIARSIQIMHPFGRLLATGISAYFFIRFALFTFANLGFIGEISVNLPFVSSGSFNYLTDAFLVGVFLSVWRRSSFMKDSGITASYKDAIKT